MVCLVLLAKWIKIEFGIVEFWFGFLPFFPIRIPWPRPIIIKMVNKGCKSWGVTYRRHLIEVVAPGRAAFPIPHFKIMFTGFSRIIEERIRKAQKKGVFDNLEGSGKPLNLENDSHIAEDLRLAHKILKNADCLPPEIELKKEIERTEDLLGGMQDTAQKHRTLKKLNYLIMKLNAVRDTSIELEMPQQYSYKLVERLETVKKTGNQNE